MPLIMSLLWTRWTRCVLCRRNTVGRRGGRSPAGRQIINSTIPAQIPHAILVETRNSSKPPIMVNALARRRAAKPCAEPTIASTAPILEGKGFRMMKPFGSRRSAAKPPNMAAGREDAVSFVVVVVDRERAQATLVFAQCSPGAAASAGDRNRIVTQL